MQKVYNKNIYDFKTYQFQNKAKLVNLGEICKFKKGKKISKKDLTDYGFDCIHYGQLYTKYDKFITNTYSKTKLDKKQLVFSKKYDILLAATGETPRDICKAYCIMADDIAIGNDIIIINTQINSIFLTYYLNYLYKDIAKISQGVTVYHIKIDDLKKLSIKIPSNEIQKSICDFLLLFEKRINLLKRKKEAYEKIKEYLLRHLFPKNNDNKPKLNFGNSLWTYIKLSDYGIAHNGLTGKSKDDFGEGKKYLEYKAILSDEFVDMNMISYVKINNNERQYCLKKNDIIFSISSELPFEVAMASLVPDITDEIYLNSFCYAYTIKDKTKLNPLFLVYYFRSPNMRQKIIKLSQGSTRYNLSKNTILNMNIPITSQDNQKKIVNILKNIDKKITNTRDEIDIITKYKKTIISLIFY